MIKSIKTILKPIIFILIFGFVFAYLSNLFCRKNLEGAWNHTEKISGFYNEPTNEFDIMYFGSSNTYCSFNPLILFEESKLKSYVFATQQQPVWATYAYMKEALKTQTPQLLVMDILMFAKDVEYYDDGVNFSFMDNLPLSKNKIELAVASAEPKKRLELLANFIKYHSRWNELTEDDYTFKRNEMHDYLKGYVLLEDTFPTATKIDTSNITEITALSEKEIVYFNKIVELSNEKNIPLMLVKAPSNASVDDQKLFNSVKKLAKENNIDYIDYNQYYSQIEFVMNTDFYDKSHLNYKGAEKFTKYFANDIKNRYSLIPSETNNQTENAWKNCLATYYEYCSNLQ